VLCRGAKSFSKANSAETSFTIPLENPLDMLETLIPLLIITFLLLLLVGLIANSVFRW